MAPLSFAPTELGLVCDRSSYRHHAPTELKRWLRPRPRRCREITQTEMLPPALHCVNDSSDL
jgi:hypothetical protein